jgi:hypothetical protein
MNLLKSIVLLKLNLLPSKWHQQMPNFHWTRQRFTSSQQGQAFGCMTKIHYLTTVVITFYKENTTDITNTNILASSVPSISSC